MLRIKTLKLSDINPASYNPRISLQPGDPAYEKLKASMSRFGCVEPLVWNQRTGNLVGGHQRLSVLKNEGVEKVRVSVVDLSLEDEKALNLAAVYQNSAPDQFSSIVNEYIKKLV
ncbi:MAG: ParB N-terminal domain-containing protein [Candidatus Hinthialibacter antarcticus]|nr:ParB N-terminal domain-containing protein [Candidatus Hinthialibacter antarcticus]